MDLLLFIAFTQIVYSEDVQWKSDLMVLQPTPGALYITKKFYTMSEAMNICYEYGSDIPDLNMLLPWDNFEAGFVLKILEESQVNDNVWFPLWNKPNSEEYSWFVGETVDKDFWFSVPDESGQPFYLEPDKSGNCFQVSKKGMYPRLVKLDAPRLVDVGCEEMARVICKSSSPIVEKDSSGDSEVSSNEYINTVGTASSTDGLPIESSEVYPVLIGDVSTIDTPFSNFQSPMQLNTQINADKSPRVFPTHDCVTATPWEEIPQAITVIEESIRPSKAESFTSEMSMPSAELHESNTITMPTKNTYKIKTMTTLKTLTLKNTTTTDFVTSKKMETVRDIKGNDNVPVHVCPCPCTSKTIISPEVSLINTTQLTRSIRQALTVDVSNTSLAIRRKTSAKDFRITSHIAGTMGICILVASLVCLVAMDTDRLFHFSRR